MNVSWGTAELLRPEVLEAALGLDLRAKVLAEGFLAGLHRSILRGFSAEFAGHRRYASGEPSKAIDWTVWARTNKLYVREFQADTNIDCTLVVDASASMGYGPAGMTKLRYAVDLAGALAVIMARQGDPTGLIVLGRKRLEGLRPSAKPGSLMRLLGVLAGLRAEGDMPFAQALESALVYLRKRGLVALLSDFHPPSDAGKLLRLVAAMRAKGHDVILFHILDVDEIRPPFREDTELEDMETGRRATLLSRDISEYCSRIAAWRAELSHLSRACGADYVPLDTGCSLAGALASYLARRSGR